MLHPVSEILNGDPMLTTTTSKASGDEAERLSRRAANLRARARILRTNAETRAAMETLRARMALY